MQKTMFGLAARTFSVAALGAVVIVSMTAGGLKPAAAEDVNQCLAKCGQWFGTERVNADCQNSNDGKPHMGYGTYENCQASLGANYQSRKARCEADCRSQ